MYQNSYSEAIDDTGSTARTQEELAFERSIELLEIAAKKGVSTRETIDALLYGRKLWAFLLEDLSKRENGLPEKLRADLISIGLWVLKEMEKIRTGKSDNFSGIIDVSKIISVGLK